MKFKLIIPLVFIFSYTAILGENIVQRLDRSVFYAALKSENVEEIDHELEVLKLAHSPEKEAFEGALLMKKAGLVKIPAEKLKFLNRGALNWKPN